MIIPNKSKLKFYSISKLENLIIYLKYHYYNGNPKVSDEYYDLVEEYLKKLHPESYVFDIVGSDFKKSDDDVKHSSFIGSLDTMKAVSDLESFIKESDFNILKIMPKYDGMTCVLKYKNGKLISAGTRGNGKTGKNIFHHVLRNNSIPKNILFNGECEIRGECVCINDKHRELGYKNRRNAISGILNRKNPCNPDDFVFIPFEFIENGKSSVELPPYIKESSSFEYHLYLEKLDINGLTIDEINEKLTEIFNSLIHKKGQKFSSSVEIKDPINNIIYDIDGLVIECGNNKKAWKIFQSENIEKVKTTVKNIEFRTTKTGNIFPRLIVEPVEIGGTIIKHISGESIDKLEKLNLGVGSDILIYRANGVIPKVYKVLTEGNLELPDKCPSCGFEIIRKDAFIFCNNKNCSESKIKELIYFFKKLEIKYISEKTIRTIVNEFFDYVPSIFDFIRFLNDNFKIIKTLDGYGEKRVEKIKKEINKLYDNQFTLSDIIIAIGIENFGEKSVKKYFEKFNIGDINDFIDSLPYLEGVEGIGRKTGPSIIHKINYLIDRGLIKFIFSLNLENERSEQKIVDYKTFCISGKFDKSRKEIIKIIEGRFPNWKFNKSVTKKLDLLIVDNKIKSSKINKAEKYGIGIIRCDNLDEILENLNKK